MKITISEKVQQFISERTDKAGGYYEYIRCHSTKTCLRSCRNGKAL